MLKTGTKTQNRHQSNYRQRNNPLPVSHRKWTLLDNRQMCRFSRHRAICLIKRHRGRLRNKNSRCCSSRIDHLNHQQMEEILGMECHRNQKRQEQLATHRKLRQRQKLQICWCHCRQSKQTRMMIFVLILTLLLHHITTILPNQAIKTIWSSRVT